MRKMRKGWDRGGMQGEAGAEEACKVRLDRGGMQGEAGAEEACKVRLDRGGMQGEAGAEEACKVRLGQRRHVQKCETVLIRCCGGAGSPENCRHSLSYV